MNLNELPSPKKSSKLSEARTLETIVIPFWFVVNSPPWRGFSQSPAIRHSKQALEVGRSIQAVWVWEGSPSCGGLALSQLGDGWVTGLRALREGGSQPTPEEHTAKQTAEGTSTGEPSPQHYPSHQRNAVSTGFLVLMKSASQPDPELRALGQALNHILFCCLYPNSNSWSFPEIPSSQVAL